MGLAVFTQSQSYQPVNRPKGLLTDIGTEELAHWEIIATMIFKLTHGASAEAMREAGLGGYYTMHDTAVFPVNPDGVPWTAAYIQATGDPVTDLHEDLAAEKKAETTYQHLIRLTDDPGIKDTLQFLRQREVNHFQRFGEALDHVQEHMGSKKVF
ncbi:MAG: manganese catalase family protein [Desulfocucumaceae bacterium]